MDYRYSNVHEIPLNYFYEVMKNQNKFLMHNEKRFQLEFQ